MTRTSSRGTNDNHPQLLSRGRLDHLGRLLLELLNLLIQLASKPFEVVELVGGSHSVVVEGRRNAEAEVESR